MRIPGNRADGLATQIVQRQTLLLGLDVPDGHEAAAAAGGQDVRDLFVPVDRFKVIGACGGRAQAEGVGNIVEVGDEELHS